jgi:F0F1-type ATP synthase assembly protein I
MNKPLVGLAAGGVLGIFDGLSALVSAPETAPQIAGIVVGSTIKGLIAGVVIGLVARKVRSLPLGLIVGLGVGLLLALPIAMLNHYYWQILLPGALVGLIVGYLTQRYGTSAARIPRAGSA